MIARYIIQFSEINHLLSSILSDNALQNTQTALHIAAMHGDTETLKLLLDHKLDLNAVDKV